MSHRSEYDTPWKNILDKYFEEFIAYCWPQHYEKIDWSRGYKSLDKELSKISKHASVGNRITDKVMEICLKNGLEMCVLIHIEVQGSYDAGFEDRLFTGRYRLRDLYKKPIASLAILIDTNKKWRPSSYREEFWDSSIEMKFPIIKLIDYKNRIPELEASSNPFAAVILAQLAVIEKKDPENKLISKIKLIKWLFGRGWKKEDVATLLIFIDWIFALPLELELECSKEIERIEGEKKMNYVTSWERIGMRQGNMNILMLILQHKFKEIPDKYKNQIANADEETLKKWSVQVIDSKVLEDVFV